MKVQLSFALLVVAVFVHLSVANPLIADKICRTDQCGGKMGLQCCPGYVCQLPSECCDQLGRCTKVNSLPLSTATSVLHH